MYQRNGKIKHCPLKKKSPGKGRKHFFPEGVRTSIPKPKFPRLVLWDAHKPESPPINGRFDIDRA